jgi:hypothetical protein
MWAHFMYTVVTFRYVDIFYQVSQCYELTGMNRVHRIMTQSCGILEISVQDIKCLVQALK